MVPSCSLAQMDVTTGDVLATWDGRRLVSAPSRAEGSLCCLSLCHPPLSPRAGLRCPEIHKPRACCDGRKEHPHRVTPTVVLAFGPESQSPKLGEGQRNSSSTALL